MSQQRSNKLFRRQALNFSYVKAGFPNLEVSPDIPGMVPCPLCFQTFLLETYGHDLISKEHAPPKGFGGKIVCITCKDCNNRHGSTLDRPLRDYYHVVQSLSGSSTRSLDADVCLPDSSRIRVEFNVPENGKWQISPIVKASDPVHLDKMNHMFIQASTPPYEDISFTLRVLQPHDRIVRVALLRVAYLLAFGHFGYGFVVNPALNYARALFRHPDDENLYPHGVIFNASIDDQFLGASIITQPQGMRAYLVTFDLFDGEKAIDRIGVVLPGWMPNPLKLYDFLDSIHGTQVEMKLHKIVDAIDFYLEAPFAALDHWNSLFAESEP